ncbi:MAG: Rrf2 family transcriptional regulator [Lentisphaeria bacterium]|nr:Rrf2 family transcriptional regulator [Lentisphaeria bacterium]
MKISTRGRYGLRILLDLALHTGEAPRMIRAIAQSQQISEKYISRLIIDLRRAGFVSSVRGVQGGFRLARRPESITVLDVIEVMEGPVGIVDCVLAPDHCRRQKSCAALEIWTRLNRRIRSEFASVTLQEIIDGHRRLNGEDSATADYCI